MVIEFSIKLKRKRYVMFVVKLDLYEVLSKHAKYNKRTTMEYILTKA
jgi:hypothetical protein